VAKVDIFPSTKRPHFIIPVDALVEAEGDKGYVYTVDKETMTAKRIPIAIGFLVGDKVAVESGLEDTAEVVGYETLVGDTVSVSADALYFKEPEVEYYHSWKRSDLPSDEQPPTEQSPSRHTELAPFEVDKIGTVTVSLKTDNGFEGDEREEASGSVMIDVYEEWPEGSSSEGEGEELGMLGIFFPGDYRALFNAVFAIGLIVVFLLVNHMIGDRKRVKETVKGK
jgi:hypothetical protein